MGAIAMYLLRFVWLLLLWIAPLGAVAGEGPFFMLGGGTIAVDDGSDYSFSALIVGYAGGDSAERSLAFELGVLDVGHEAVDGLYAVVTPAWQVAEHLELSLSGGFHSGDNSSLVGGVGAAIPFNDRVALVAQYRVWEDVAESQLMIRITPR